MSSSSPALPNQAYVAVPIARGPKADDAVTKLQSIYGTRKAPFALDIIVVGCGVGGLSAAICLTQAGHRVTILESFPVIAAIGAGITLGPNSSRLVRRWGLGKQLDEIAIKPEGASLRTFSTGERVGYAKWEGVLERDYGAPSYQIHRAHLHKILYDLIAPHVTVLLDSTVVGCDPDPVLPSVTLKSGEVLKADLIIGADGLKSYIQQVVSGKPNAAEPTGDAAYRATVPSSLLMQDPELREFIEHPHLENWMGPGKHIVTYPVVRPPSFVPSSRRKYADHLLERGAV
jgi:salicylate hydroxylase